MINEIKKDASIRMGKSLDSLRQDLTRLRTGRASPALVEHLMVDYYGTATPISQVATVSVSDARTLSLSPWEKQMVPILEKAIIESDLGLNPITAGEVIRIPIPPLTEERRKEMSKIVKAEGENGKVAIRNIRRDANQNLKELLKAKEITKDEDKDAEDDIQKITDQNIKLVDEVVVEKEQEIMEV